MKEPKKIRRQAFVLTSEEKKAIACVLGALLLGLATMHYRAHHPRPAPPPTATELRAAKAASAKEKAQSRRASRNPRPVPPEPQRDGGD